MSIFRNMKRLFLATVLACVGLATESAAAGCNGTLYFQAPENWTSVYVVYEQKTTPVSTIENGWYVINLATADANGWGRTKFGLTNGTDIWNSTGKVLTNVWNGTGDVGNQTDTYGFDCPGDGKTFYISENTATPGVTYYGTEPPNATTLYVLIPEAKEWQSTIPMISADGGVTGKALIADSKRCGWYYVSYFNTEPPDSLIIYREDDPEDKIGMGGLASDAFINIPLKHLFDSLGVKELFFIPDDAAWPDDGSTNGWYTEDNGVEGVCTYSLAAVIYDTDEMLNPVFSSDGNNSGLPGACLGVRHGIVQEFLGPDNKPLFNSSSVNGASCFGSETTFKTLFNYTPNVNEVVCYDLTFTRSADGRWAYDSDEAVTGATKGGFYPVENTDDNSVVTMNGVKMGPTIMARNKRKAQGPVPSTIPDFDKYCNTPGWTGGVECEGLFDNGDHPASAWNWGAPRWETTRNQQFCFESHATFTYKEGQEFTFRGDDDIWIFIGGRLAVDNGGTHLAAPGHVVLSNLKDKNGEALVPGKDYAIDIFFCDRRTTMSNVIIKTNMYIKQSQGLDYSVKDKDPSGNISYDICWEESGDGSCAAVALGAGGTSSTVTRLCGKDIESVGKSISYSIVTRGGELVAALPGGKVWYGGFDLTDPYNPKINTNKAGGLNPGSYRLVIEVDGKKTYINFRIKGNLDLVNQTVTYNPLDGDSVSTFYKAGTEWNFVDKAIAGTRVPLYVSAVAEGDIDLLSAVGQNYSLTTSAGMMVYTSKTGDEVAAFPRTIDSTGVDTLWATVSLGGMTASPEVKTAQVRANVANISFYAPSLKFVSDIEVDSLGNIIKFTEVTGDPDSLDGEEYYNWVGSDVDLDLLIWNPITDKVCSECVLSLEASEASPRVDVTVPTSEKGVALVRIRSYKEYMDTTASFTISATDNPLLVNAAYSNMKFREPPVPYPVMVELFDTRGETAQTSLRIPTPYHTESQEYLDGIADSVSIVYHRKIHQDSLPNFICLQWDEEKNFDLKNFNFNSVKGLPSSVKKDSLVTCSDTIGYSQIKSAWETRLNDSTLTFNGIKFSSEVKTAGEGKLRSWATFEDRKQITVQSFDRATTDKMAPVIIKARLSTTSANKDFDNIRFVFSEPITAKDSTKLLNAIAYYMPSATEYDPNDRYDAPSSVGKIALGSDSATTQYRHLQGEKILKTPQVGDYARFAEGVLTDTLGNAPTGYKASIPSPWFTITGDVRSIVRTVNYAELNVNDPTVQKNLADKKIVTVARFDTYDSLGVIRDSLPNTVGHWINTDIGNFLEGLQAKYPKENLTIEDVELRFEVSYFTNLGSFVAKADGKIKCTDKDLFDGDCTKNPGYLYIGWNGISNDGRLVGSGAYISKFTSVLKVGRHKEAKHDKTNVFGMRRILGKK